MISFVSEPDEVDIPNIILDKDKNIFEFSGRSLPEDAEEFFRPVLNWIDAYVQIPNESTKLEFRMDYFNTSSSKSILEILEKFENILDAGKAVKVIWYYNNMDEDMLEAGQDYSKMVRLPFEFISYEEGL
ncbi:MAG: DUF1987 domain-containing protein [Bacteroidales bacterium]|nr:DUF1987 domain-containing protein [Bacteroidales bacterium]